MANKKQKRHDLIYPNVTSHPLIAELCVELAQTVYEEMCSGSNALYKVHADRHDFVRQCAPTLKQHAKTLLGAMLHENYRPPLSDSEKQAIYEALIMDNELPKDGVSVARLN